jgi:hypothetical protein
VQNNANPTQNYGMGPPASTIPKVVPNNTQTYWDMSVNPPNLWVGFNGAWIQFTGGGGGGGVPSIAGTANQIVETGSPGATTLSLPSHIITPGQVTVTGALTVDGILTSFGATELISTNNALDDNSASAAATLLNAPTAGNPTKWFAIIDAGTTRYIPAW